MFYLIIIYILIFYLFLYKYSILFHDFIILFKDLILKLNLNKFLNNSLNLDEFKNTESIVVKQEYQPWYNNKYIWVGISLGITVITLIYIFTNASVNDSNGSVIEVENEVLPVRGDELSLEPIVDTVLQTGALIEYDKSIYIWISAGLIKVFLFTLDNMSLEDFHKLSPMGQFDKIYETAYYVSKDVLDVYIKAHPGETLNLTMTDKLAKEIIDQVQQRFKNDYYFSVEGVSDETLDKIYNEMCRSMKNRCDAYLVEYGVTINYSK